MDVQASVIITTKNRKNDLRRALRSVVTQSILVEVIVVDDGSTDGTEEMVRSDFPQVLLHRCNESRGLIVRRNEAARLARGRIIVSLDDDAEFSSPIVIQEALAQFDHIRIGAVAIPFVNVLAGTTVLQCAPSPDGRYIIDSFIGTANAVRSDIFLRLSGYREEFVHQGEERDFCLRMLAQGYVVRLGTGESIHHYESSIRNFQRMDYYGRRNDILFTWLNVPMPQFFPHLIGTTINGISFALRCGRFWNHFRGIVAGYLDIGGYFSERRPVSAAVYRLQRQLRKTGPRRLGEIEKRLPPLPASARKLIVPEAAVTQ